jgi:hypothetical protein
VSAEAVDCVIYTRHSRARDLDSDLLVINFSLDKSSLSRRGWAPTGARIVFAAFGGELLGDAAVNFLEHHVGFHALPLGAGTVCPTTLPDTKIRSCDAVQCDRCFQRPAPLAAADLGEPGAWTGMKVPAEEESKDFQVPDPSVESGMRQMV